jgi:hypothetical protein
VALPEDRSELFLHLLKEKGVNVAAVIGRVVPGLEAKIVVKE